MHRQQAEHAKAIEKALKPKTLDEMLEEFDLEIAEDSVGASSVSELVCQRPSPE